ncbi:LysR family transcriptional regulator [Marinomonas sp. 15G1-11]|uniref:LysR family transcriptional regulator n=1 Tax=Marinomonas phaeophyticola TaxID=3004091 RepID=A0ABT4JVT4_9GAMM|nr:LysR family transcriptional regulator [Marinomonas sp. 15G1-11]MCZ2722177.1 LysR family transcriptional regulator [Marinomonas sp. 15G1-11]
MERMLIHFKEVVLHGNMSMASEALAITQPAISKSIQLLEQRYGTPLLIRGGRGVTLTPAGQILLDSILRMERELASTQSEIERLLNNKEYLRIGAGPVWEKRLNTIIPDFLLRHPHINVEILSGPIANLLPSLINGDIDVALGGNDSYEDTFSKQLSFFPIYNNRICIMADRFHPMANHKQKSLQLLCEYPWVGFQKSTSIMEKFNNLLERERLKPVRLLLESDYISTVMETMKKTEALLCISSQLVQSIADHRLVEIPISEPIWEFKIGAWTQPTIKNNYLVKEFISLLKESDTRY